MATVLVVDDDPISRDFLRTLLGYRGHRACEASDGDTALSLARRRLPDAVITDVLMPNVGGYELARTLRSQPATSHIPIAFSTAHYGHEEIEPLARACGVQDVIFKPALPTTVLATIDALLGGGRPPAGPAAGPDRSDAGEVAYWRRDAAHVADRLAETHRLTQSGTWDLDPRTGEVVLSAGLCDLLRLTSPRVSPEQLRQRVHPEDLGKLTAMARNVWCTGLPDLAEVRVADLDGAVHELIVSCRASEPGAGKPARMVWGVAQDVTQVRHAQRAYLHAQATWHAERRAVDAFHRANLPQSLPLVAGVDLGAIYLAAPERLDIGAGWYDVQDIGGGRILMSVGRVAGHDQPAAAAMAPILAVLRAYALDDPDPAHLLTRLNRLMTGMVQDDTFVTAVVAVYEPGNGRLSLANAGHPAPLLLGPGRGGDPVAAPLAGRGPALGVFTDVEFTGQYRTMAPGSVLCAYTDGLTDRPAADVQTDADRLPGAAAGALGELVADRPHLLPDAQELAERILREILGGDPPDDDVCLAVLWAAGCAA